jgi:hypothetical protein
MAEKKRAANSREETVEPATKVAELHLPYYKQGDDMSRYLGATATVAEALEEHARHMDVAATMLRTLKDAIAGHDVTISADTHLIAVAGPVALIDQLIEEELLVEDQWDPEADDEDDDDLDEEDLDDDDHDEL